MFHDLSATRKNTHQRAQGNMRVHGLHQVMDPLMYREEAYVLAFSYATPASGKIGGVEDGMAVKHWRKRRPAYGARTRCDPERYMYDAVGRKLSCIDGSHQHDEEYCGAAWLPLGSPFHASRATTHLLARIGELRKVLTLNVSSNKGPQEKANQHHERWWPQGTARPSQYTTLHPCAGR
jgi:hypothetical protein